MVTFDPALRAELAWLPVFLSSEAHQHPVLSACIVVVEQGRFVRPLASTDAGPSPVTDKE